jgi:hypothetical protein
MIFKKLNNKIHLFAHENIRGVFTVEVLYNDPLDPLLRTRFSTIFFCWVIYTENKLTVPLLIHGDNILSYTIILSYFQKFSPAAAKK